MLFFRGSRFPLNGSFTTVAAEEVAVSAVAVDTAGADAALNLAW